MINRGVNRVIKTTQILNILELNNSLTMYNITYNWKYFKQKHYQMTEALQNMLVDDSCHVDAIWTFQFNQNSRRSNVTCIHKFLFESLLYCICKRSKQFTSLHPKHFQSIILKSVLTVTKIEQTWYWNNNALHANNWNAVVHCFLGERFWVFNQ